MPLGRARRTELRDHAGGVIYRQQYVRCGKATCPPAGPGHGPYWYGFYWDYRQRTTSFYVGKHLPRGVEVLPDPALPTDANLAPSEPITDRQEDDTAADNTGEVIPNRATADHLGKCRPAHAGLGQ